MHVDHNGTNEQNATLGQRSREGFIWPTFEILRPPRIHISRTVEARNFKYGMVKFM